MTLLKIENISKSFGEQKLLKNLSMDIEEGKIYSLIGANGSGKTTLFNILTGFTKADSGKITFDKKFLNYKSPTEINRLGIVRTFQDLRIITQLTVKENILLSFRNNPGEKIYNAILPSRIFKKQYAVFLERAEVILEKIHLQEVKNNLASEISYGQQKLLTIGCCLANDAKLLLLDEPIAGIDKENYNKIFNLIVQLKKEGKSILQIEHNHIFIESISDVIGFLNAGEITTFSDYKTFINNPIVKKTYSN
jgi:branched-chain amino acid transport system ATP-binding protein